MIRALVKIAKVIIDPPHVTENVRRLTEHEQAKPGSEALEAIRSKSGTHAYDSHFEQRVIERSGLSQGQARKLIAKIKEQIESDRFGGTRAPSNQAIRRVFRNRRDRDMNMDLTDSKGKPLGRVGMEAVEGKGVKLKSYFSPDMGVRKGRAAGAGGGRVDPVKFRELVDADDTVKATAGTTDELGKRLGGRLTLKGRGKLLAKKLL